MVLAFYALHLLDNVDSGLCYAFALKRLCEVTAIDCCGAKKHGFDGFPAFAIGKMLAQWITLYCHCSYLLLCEITISNCLLVPLRWISATSDCWPLWGLADF